MTAGLLMEIYRRPALASNFELGLSRVRSDKAFIPGNAKSFRSNPLRRDSFDRTCFSCAGSLHKYCGNQEYFAQIIRNSAVLRAGFVVERFKRVFCRLRTSALPPGVAMKLSSIKNL